MRFRERTPPQSERSKLGDHLPPKFASTLPESLRRALPLHAHGLGVSVGEKQRFYPLDQLQDAGVIHDRIGNARVVVLVQDGSASAAAYSRCIDGDVLQFEAVTWEGQRALRDTTSHTTWTADGRAVKGGGRASSSPRYAR